MVIPLLLVGVLAGRVTTTQAAKTNIDWPYYGSDLGNTRYVNTDIINTSNVSRLQPAWVFHMGVMNSPRLSLETQPIEVGGTVYVTSGEDHVFALDATTGALKWTYNPQLPNLANMAICCGVDNRGVAVGDGKVFVGQLDGQLVALNASNGAVQWKQQVASYEKKYTVTMAPQFVDGMVLVGVSGGEFETRGSLTAFDAQTGRQVWRFYTVPGPGQVGHVTWAGNSWKTGSATVWDTPAVDPALGLVYFGTGNAGPDLSGSTRAGANLFSSSIVALDIKTGKLRWYYQEVHHDLWDYDGPQPVSLFTVVKNGRSIPALGHANKDGFYFILNRRTGTPIYPIPEVRVPTTAPAWQHAWPTQPEGIALEPHAVAVTPKGMTSAPAFTPPQPAPTLIQPGYETGPEWTPAAFSPRTGYVYVPSGGYEPWVYHAVPQEYNSTGSTGMGVKSFKIKSYGLFDAVNTRTGKIAWELQTPFKALSGMTVAGNLVFFGESTGRFNAINAATGKTLWSYVPNMKGAGGANAPPAVYVRNGREYVVMAFGGNFRERQDYQTATSQMGDAIIAFSLPAGGAIKPNVVTAHPQLVKTGAPEMFPPSPHPSPGAQVVTLTVHDLHFFPSQFTVHAGMRVAVHLINTGIIPIQFGIKLPAGPIGLQGQVKPGQKVYFQFMAPSKPGAYTIFGPGDAEFHGMLGTMHVVG